MYNILVADDSALMRKIMCDIINSIDGCHVSDVCADGEIAYRHILKNKYDAVTFSVTMPSFDGIKLLKQLREENIKVPVIIISTTIVEDKNLAKKAVELGASDFVVRPLTVRKQKVSQFSENLEKALHAALNGTNVRVFVADEERGGIRDERKQDVKEPVRDDVESRRGGKPRFELVAIASSTGGPAALSIMVPMLKNFLRVPVVIVQHMPGGFTSTLAERIDAQSVLRVKEARNGETLKEDNVYIAPGGHQLRIAKSNFGEHIFKVTKEPPINNLRPCADVMYESLLTSGYERILCVVLTGMGADGAAGIKRLHAKKSIEIITQNAASSVVYGMPKATHELGLSDTVCDIKEIANMIAKKLGV